MKLIRWFICQTLSVRIGKIFYIKKRNLGKYHVMEQNMQETKSISEKIKVFFANNPDKAYLALIGVIALFLIGVIFNWQWVCRPRTWLGNYFVELFGPTTFRFWYAVFLILAIIVLLFFYFKVYK